MTHFKNQAFGIVVLLAFSLASAAQSRFNKLVWSDEFTGNGLPDSSKWGYDKGNGCPDNCGWGNHELEYYTTARAENARVENGVLIIEARKEDYSGAAYTSARLVTKNKGDWQYGRFEIKAKIARGVGMWPAIWMLPTKWAYGSWPKSGEIDIMENVGYWAISIFGTVHTGAFNGMLGTQKSKSIPFTDLSAAFHVYKLEWTPDSISFYVDDKLYNVFTNRHTGVDAWPFDQQFHLLLNVAVGGDWGGKFGVDNTIFPQKMLVDYVRVYQ